MSRKKKKDKRHKQKQPSKKPEIPKQMPSVDSVPETGTTETPGELETQESRKGKGGTKSPEISCRNSTVHGGYGQEGVLMPWETQETYQAFVDAELDYWEPKTDKERYWFKKMVWQIWLIRRVEGFIVRTAEANPDQEVINMWQTRLSRVTRMHGRERDRFEAELCALQVVSLNEYRIARGEPTDDDRMRVSVQDRVQAMADEDRIDPERFQARILTDMGNHVPLQAFEAKIILAVPPEMFKLMVMSSFRAKGAITEQDIMDLCAAYVAQYSGAA